MSSQTTRLNLHALKNHPDTPVASRPAGSGWIWWFNGNTDSDGDDLPAIHSDPPPASERDGFGNEDAEEDNSETDDESSDDEETDDGDRNGEDTGDNGKLA